jgi:hypothetical protein
MKLFLKASEKWKSRMVALALTLRYDDCDDDTTTTTTTSGTVYKLTCQ